MGEALGSSLRPGDVLLLSGELGAGKTVVVRGLARGLGYAGEVLSPTFQLLRVYPGRLRLAHVDLYRLEAPGETEDLGLEELLDDGAAAIEWGERLDWPAAPRLNLEVLSPQHRRLVLRGAPDHWSW